MGTILLEVSIGRDLGALKGLKVHHIIPSFAAVVRLYISSRGTYIQCKLKLRNVCFFVVKMNRNISDLEFVQVRQNFISGHILVKKKAGGAIHRRFAAKNTRPSVEALASHDAPNISNKILLWVR